MPNPSWIIIAAPRCGTTSLYNYIGQHPRAARAKGAGWREIGFFCHDHVWRKGAEWYRAQFPRGKSAGETTPVYLRTGPAPERIASVCPDARFICLLRNPTDRAWSAFCLARAKGWPVSGPLNVPGGRYARHLKRWFERFPREQFLILQSERAFGDWPGTMDRVWAFLDLHPFRLARYRVWHASPGLPLSDRMRGRLDAKFARHNRELEALLGWDTGWAT